MRIAIACLLASLVIGCASVTSQQAQEINDRLARVEKKLDEMAARTQQVVLVPQDDQRLAQQDEISRLFAEITQLQLAGFTDKWPAMKRAKQDLAARIAEFNSTPH